MATDIEIKVARLEEQIAAAKEALTLQSEEYQRRLDILNGEAGQLKAMQAKYLPREVADNEFKNIHSKIEALQRLVYIGVGVIIALEIILQIIK
jgi:hypothetical protein